MFNPDPAPMSLQDESLVSVVIPAYNYAHLIQETLQSVQAQTYQNWECIVVDDGSTDNTADVVRAVANADPRVRYIYQPRGRQAAARNTGIQNARGNYFQFLDADDLIEEKKLEQQVRFLANHPEVDITYVGARYFRDDDVSQRLLSRQYSTWEGPESWMPEVSGTGEQLLPILLRNNITVMNSPLMRRRVIDQIGPFDTSLTAAEDWLYLIKCAVAGMTFSFNDFERGRALVRAHASSDSRDQLRYRRGILTMRRKVSALLRSPEHQKLNRLMSAEAEGHAGVEEIAAGLLGAGMTNMFRAALHDSRPRFKAKWLICAASAPFVSSDRLKGMVTSSLSGSLKRIDASQA